jgi:tripartite-type tricarboxylate transporter receptor subunit TctC
MRRTFLLACALACSTGFAQDPSTGSGQAPSTGSGQAFPTRSVRLLVPNAPGSSIDTMSRILAAKLGDALGQPVFVENRDGAGGLIGVEAGRNAKPDGYTLICASNGSMIIAPLLKRTPPYDAVADFAAVGSFAVTPNVLIVNPDLPVRSVRELIDYARANASKINMATAGIGSQSHLSGVLLMSMAGFDSLAVPHKGGGPSVNSVIAGQTHWTITPAPAVMAFVKNGRLRAIGQSLPRRSAMLEGIPPVADTVPGYDYSGWAGLVAPKGTPAPVVEKLNSALAKTLAIEEVTEGLAKQGAEVFEGSPEDFRKFLVQDQANTAKVIKAAKLQAD